MPQHKAVIGLGANLGEPSGTLRLALDLLARTPGLSLSTASRFFETEPVGGDPGQPRFANAIAIVYSQVNACKTLELLQKIEDELGRTRQRVWAARTLDLDLLAFDDQIMMTESLILPHPRMTVRRFVVEPLFEIAPGWVHPQLGWSVVRLRDHLSKTDKIVQVGGLVQVIGSDPELARKIKTFQAENQGWSFSEKTAEPLFEVSLFKDFMSSRNWAVPRFYATSDRMDILVDQMLATCEGLTNKGWPV